MWIVVSMSLGTYALYCVYMKFIKGICQCQADLSGKTVIITGCDKGIGYFTALNMAQRNARVILACRNVESAQRAADEIRTKTGNKNLVVEHVEMSSLKSVRLFAEKIKSTENGLDILINNAGTLDSSNTHTEDGLLVMLATNYIGPFLLTHLLLDKLKQSAPSRIVNVASVAHKFCGPLDLSNLNGEKFHNDRTAYYVSKLALVTYTRELGKRLQGTGVTVNSVHPGSVNTNIFSSIPQPFKFIMNIIALIFFRSAEDGAQTSIHVAVSKEIEGVTGQYFSECKIAKPSKHCFDEAVAKKLYERSEFYAKIH